MTVWPFGKKQTQGRTTDFIYSEENPPDDVKTCPEHDEWDLEMTVPIREISALYLQKNWQLAIADDGKAGGVPLPAGVLDFIVKNVTKLAYNDEALYLSLGRMHFIKDEDFPDSIEIYVHVGTASLRSADEEGVLSFDCE